MTTAVAPSRARFERPAAYKDEITAPADHIRLLTIPPRRYFALEGDARPGEQGFKDAIATLYPLAYTLHFALKKRGVEAPVGALEGLFWTRKDHPLRASEFGPVASSAPRWRWRLMLPIPKEARAADIDAAIGEVRAKKAPTLMDRVTTAEWEEGRVAQIMHVGPYSAEAPTIENLHRAIEDSGLELRGCHHEIYISDPGRTKPERMKTLIRQPVTEG